MIKATCHPNRQHEAKGLCKSCYRRQFQDPRCPLISQAKGRAKRDKIKFNLIPNDIIIPSICPVLGIPIITARDSEQTRSGPTDNSPSIDRVDSSLGYVRGNVMVISNRANRLKGDGTAEEHAMLNRYIKGWNNGKA